MQVAVPFPPGRVELGGRASVVRGSVLALLLFLLFSVDYVSLSWTATSPVSIGGRVLAALLVSAVVSLVLREASGPRGTLIGATFAVVYGTMYLLPATETVYVGSVLSTSTAITTVAIGLFIAAAFSFAAVALFGPQPAPGTDAPPRLSMPWREWGTKFLVLAAVWTLLFLLFGLLVYRPIAQALDPTGFTSEQSTVTNPALALLSQPLWGIAWVALAVPLIRSPKTDWHRTALAVGGLFGALMGADLLMATGMSGGLQLGHLAESVGESVVFGVCAVWVLQLHGRLPARTGGLLPRGVRRALGPAAR